MGNRVHIEAIKAEIKELFSKKVLLNDETHGKQHNPYRMEAIDTRDKDELSELKSFRLSQYLEQHPDNTEQLFIETHIERAKELQSYFPDFKTKNGDKQYYYSLQRWIECLSTLPHERKFQNIKSVSFETVYNEEVTKERKEKLKQELSLIPSTLEKIRYLTAKKIEYLQQIAPYIIVASGSVDLPHLPKGAALFWDRYLELEIEKLKAIESTPRKLGEPETEQPNTFCPKMPFSIPRNHFKVLTDKTSKNGQPFLTIEQFDLFIERAFCGNAEIPKQRMNQVPKGEKLLIQKLFYEFYDNYCFEYFNTMQCQEEFIKILTDNFEGWEFQNVQNNFKPKTEKQL